MVSYINAFLNVRIRARLGESAQKAFVFGENHHLQGFALIHGTQDQLRGFPSFLPIPPRLPRERAIPNYPKLQQELPLGCHAAAEGLGWGDLNPAGKVLRVSLVEASQGDLWAQELPLPTPQLRSEPGPGKQPPNPELPSHRGTGGICMQMPSRTQRAKAKHPLAAAITRQ